MHYYKKARFLRPPSQPGSMAALLLPNRSPLVKKGASVWRAVNG